jgi:hypothetical protein
LSVILFAGVREDLAATPPQRAGRHAGARAAGTFLREGFARTLGDFAAALLFAVAAVNCQAVTS